LAARERFGQVLNQKGNPLMSPVQSSKKSNTGVPGVKLLIAASSLAATVGGWALISAKENTPAQPDQSAVAAQVIAPQVAVAPVFSINLAPLPTLVPAMRSQPQIVTVSNARAGSAPRPAAVAAQPAPLAAPQPALVLRDVSAPATSGASAGAPAPAAKTRSSK
jgi:hypothetical protein